MERYDPRNPIIKAKEDENEAEVQGHRRRGCAPEQQAEGDEHLSVDTPEEPTRLASDGRDDDVAQGHWRLSR